MRAHVVNYRGALDVQVPLTGITLIAGPNGAGKSSLCEAIGAALTGHPIPLLAPGTKPGQFKPQVSKADAASIINGGQKGSVLVETEQGKATIAWPDCEFATEGAAPGASVYATGLIDPLELPDKERAALLSEALGAAPTVDEFKAALRSHGYNWNDDVPDEDNVALKIWGAIEIDGWDTTHSAMKEFGAKLKGQWEEAAGRASEGKVSYGTTKAQDWTPDGWEDDLADMTEEKLYAAEASAKADLEMELGAQAVDADGLKRLQETVDARPTDEDLDKKQKAVNGAEAALAEAKEARAKLPEKVDDNEYLVQPCPHCGERVQINGRSLAKADEKRPNNDDIKKLRLEIAEASGTVSNKDSALGKAKRELREAQEAVADAIEAEAALAKHAEEGVDQSKIQAARDRVAHAQKRLAMWQAWRQCAKKHRSILNNQAAIDTLAPEGCRQKALQKALTNFNDKVLKPLCRTAGWDQVRIDEEMWPTMRGLPWVLLCKSERWRARAVVQIALAQKDHSKAVLLDGADILDKKNRNGLFKLLKALDIPALVTMTMAKSSVPDLAKAKGDIGQSYWIEGGSADPIADVMEDA